MGRHDHRIAFALIAASLVAPIARAQDVDAAQAAFDEGVEHLRAERFHEAARAFRASYREAPRVEAMCNLALTYDRWGDHLDPALRAYRTCARDDESGRYRGFAERRSAEIERELALSETAEPEPPPDPEPPASEPDLAPAPAPAPPDHTALYAGIGTGAVGLAALGTAIGLAVASSSSVDDLLARLGPTPTVARGSPEHQQLEEAQAQATAATALYVVSGVLLAASATLVVIDVVTGDAGEEAVSFVPLGPGAAVRGRF
ncbi:MAG: hypothetical protein KC619_14295 [Myxococcales bacterium]|nr:hypothetical protein [Myxococcales bacterium]